MTRAVIVDFFMAMLEYLDEDSVISRISHGFISGKINRFEASTQNDYLDFMASGMSFYMTISDYLKDIDSVSDEELEDRLLKVKLVAKRILKSSLKRKDNEDKIRLQEILNQLEDNLSNDSKKINDNNNEKPKAITLAGNTQSNFWQRSSVRDEIISSKKRKVELIDSDTTELLIQGFIELIENRAPETPQTTFFDKSKSDTSEEKESKVDSQLSDNVGESLRFILDNLSNLEHEELKEKVNTAMLDTQNICQRLPNNSLKMQKLNTLVEDYQNSNDQFTSAKGT